MRTKWKRILVASIYGGSIVLFLINSINEWILPNYRLSDIGFILSAITFHLLGHAFRAEKMILLLHPIHNQSRKAVYTSLGIGYSLNNLLPFKLGECFRAIQLGKQLQISRTAIFITIIFERTLDAIILIVFLGLLLYLHHTPHTLAFFAVLSAIIILTLSSITAVLYTNDYLLKTIGSLTHIFNETLRDRIRYALWSGIQFLKILWNQRQKIWKQYIIYSLITWICHWIAIFFLLSPISKEIITPGIASFAASSFSLQSLNLSAYNSIFQDFFHPSEEISEIATASWLLLTLPMLCFGSYCLWQKQTAFNNDAMIQSRHQHLMRNRIVSEDFFVFLDRYFKASNVTHALNEMEHKGLGKTIQILTGGSHALTVLIDLSGKKRIRKIVSNEHAEKLKEQKIWMEIHQHHCYYPKLIDANTISIKNNKYFYIDLVYYEGMSPFFIQIHQTSIEKSTMILLKTIQAIQNTVWVPLKERGENDGVEKYIHTKIWNKIEDASKMNDDIRILAKFDTIKINGIDYNNTHVSLQKILSNQHIMNDLCFFQPSGLHGDLTVDNILVSNDELIILDPNNDNSLQDIVVDIAKLYQSFHSGYEFIRNIDGVAIIENSIHFDEHRSTQYDQIFQALDKAMKERLPEERYRAILFHESVHYFRMLPYRAILNEKTSPAFYAIAVRLLHQFAEQYSENGEQPC